MQQVFDEKLSSCSIKAIKLTNKKVNSDELKLCETQPGVLNFHIITQHNKQFLNNIKYTKMKHNHKFSVEMKNNKVGENIP